MASSLNAILAAIAAMNVTVGGQPVPIRWDDTLQNTVESADLPIRLVSMLGGTAQRSKALTPTPGSAMQIEHSFDIVGILRPVGQGLGLADIQADYVDYIDSTLESSRYLGNNRWNLKLITQRSQIIQYPANSDRWYHAVLFNLVFDDRIM